MRKMFARAIFVSLGLILFPMSFASAGTATLTWNANTESDLAGYKIYYGSSARTGTCPNGGYSNSVDVGNVTSHVFNDLTDGLTYYFSVTAYDTSANESGCSAEVSKAIVAPRIYTIADFTNLVTDWLKTTSSIADVTADGVVNTRDLGVMMNSWN